MRLACCVKPFVTTRPSQRENYFAGTDPRSRCVRMGNHAKQLEKAGLGADIADSTVLDCCNVLPKLENGRITASPLD